MRQLEGESKEARSSRSSSRQSSQRRSIRSINSRTSLRQSRTSDRLPRSPRGEVSDDSTTSTTTTITSPHSTSTRSSRSHQSISETPDFYSPSQSSHIGTELVRTIASVETEKTKKKKKKRRKKTKTTTSQTAIVGLLSCILLVLIVVGSFVIYFMATNRSESTRTTTTPTVSPTLSPTLPLPRTPSLSTSPPSSSTTLPFLFDPPLPEDCTRVRNGEAVLRQDLLTERQFDVIVDVNLGVQSGQSETMIMDLLQSEIQKFLMPKLVGCSEAQNRKLRHKRMLRNPNQYIVGNAKVQWKPASENSDCSFPICLSAIFNMDLFLKTAEDQYFVIMDLVADVFGGDLIDSLQLDSPPFISAVVRSVINRNPTMAPSVSPLVSSPTRGVAAVTPSAAPFDRESDTIRDEEEEPCRKITPGQGGIPPGKGGIPPGQQCKGRVPPGLAKKQAEQTTP